MSRLLHIFICVTIVINSFSQEVRKDVVGLTTKFIENKGQWDKNVSYLTREKKQNTWLLGNGNLLLDFFKLTQFENKKQIYNENNKNINDSIKGHRVMLDWINGSEKLIFTKINKQQAYYNYLIGNNSKKYATEVNLYEEIVGKDLYNGIDIRYYFSSSNLRYDLIVHPHQDVRQIKVKLDGVSISLDNDGNVVMHSSLGDVKMQDLYVYEKETRKHIKSKWILGNDNTLSLSVGAYNTSNTLIIDPLIYSTYIGGSNNEASEDIAVNNLGEAYIIGSSLSPNFDITLGAYQTVLSGGRDCFVSKFNATGTALIYSTFFGGSDIDRGKSIVLDKFGNAYVTGLTSSIDYCVTAGVYQNSNAGLNDFDAFVTKLNSNGTALIYSSYLGGNDYDEGIGIDIDAQNNVYVTGGTTSLNFDVTVGAFKTFHSGGIYDAFVTKLNATGSSLIYSTYLGGLYRDAGTSIAVDSLNNAYVTGSTYSSDYQITTGAFQTTSANSNVMYDDIFVTKINPTGTNLVYSTYIGGSDGDVGMGIEVDNLGNAYVSGSSISIDFPVTVGAIQSTNNSMFGYPDCVIFKVNPTGSALVFSTYFGGSTTDLVLDLAIDHNLDILITGYTYSSDFFTTSSAIQPSIAYMSSSDAFLTKIDNAGTTILYSTFLGGTLWDEAHGITTDTLNKVYLTGITESTDFPVTTGVYQPNLQGTDYDAFVTKIGICPVINFSISSTNVVCNGNNNGTATINLPGSLVGYNFSWLPVSTASLSISGLSPGTYSAIVTDSTGCSTTKTVTIVQPSPVVASVSGSSITCSNQSVMLTANGGSNYLWSNGVNTNTVLVNPSITTNYSVIVSSGLCSDTSNFMVTVLPSPIANITGNDSICNGQSTLLSVSGGTNVIWSNGATTTTINANPLTTTNYSVSVSNGACADTAFTTITVLPIPNANISGNDSICYGQSTVLTASGGSNYNWSSGANTNTVSFNPNSSTNYSVIVSNGNCSDTASFLLKVFPVPVASISGADSICLAQSTILTAGGIGNYSWTNFGTSSNNIVVTPTVNTTYTLIVNNGICSDTAQKMVIVNPLPNALISGTNSICSGQSTTLTASGGTGYSWSNGGANPSISISPVSTTNYSVLVTNSFGCQSSAYTTISVVPIPYVSISGDSVICANDVLTLTANGVGDFLWNTGENSSSINTNPSNNTTYVVTASNSCGNDMDSILVIVNPLPNVVVSNDTSILINNTISLFASGGDNYAWLPAGLACNTCSVISVSPNTTMIYTVNISNTYGCSISKEIKVIVEDDFEVFIPDIFSPNGDGQNDILYVRGLGIKDLNFKIYDRWGEKVFESNDISKGWDGTYKGTPLNNAVFVYDLKANLINGSTINKHGDVTLVK